MFNNFSKMKNLVSEINDILKNYPEYHKVSIDQKENIIIKKIEKKKSRHSDTLTEIVKRLLREDLK